MLTETRARRMKDVSDIHLDEVQYEAINPIRTCAMMQGKALTADDLYGGSDAVVPAKMSIISSPDVSKFDPELEKLVGGLSGKTILVLLPTGNKQKADILKAMFPQTGHDFLFANLQGIESGVGEQPYNSAGSEGATNRMVASLASFVSGKTHLGLAETYCKNNGIGKIMVASIENYIEGTFVEVDGPVFDPTVSKSMAHIPGEAESVKSKHPTLDNAIDYGLAALYDVTARSFICAHSKGVKVPVVKDQGGKIVDFVAIAMGKGFEDDQKKYGMRTVGKTIEALVEPSPNTPNSLDGRQYKINANWHANVIGGGTDRYSLLHEAALNILRQGTELRIYDIKDHRA